MVMRHIVLETLGMSRNATAGHPKWITVITMVESPKAKKIITPSKDKRSKGIGLGNFSSIQLL
jgi:hypothetical protein